ncbi:MAG: cupin domain-containing protein [Rhodospirillaceae bacterium]|nr:cupin domain-containing protein [Rhodospirillaceae bacterium]
MAADGSQHDKAGAMSALADEVRGLGCSPFWADVQKIIAPEMRPAAKPHLWRFAEIEPRLRRAAELVPVEEAERRAFVFLNPGLPGRIATTATMYAAYSIYNGGEQAPVHRHTASAARIGLMGEGGYTTVEGEKNLISRGDLVLTPNWAWHDHGNDGTAPNIWFDILDVPLTMYLSALLFDMDYREPGAEAQPNRSIQTPQRIEDGSTNRFGFGGVLPERAERQFFFRWANTRRALELAKSAGGDPHCGVSVRLVDPRNGGPLTETIDFAARLLPAGTSTAPYRHMANSVFLVMEGQGYTEIGGERLEWRENDVFCVPTWTWHRHCNTDSARDAVLYDLSDSPLMAGLACYRRQGRDADGREHPL